MSLKPSLSAPRGGSFSTTIFAAVLANSRNTSLFVPSSAAQNVPSSPSGTSETMVTPPTLAQYTSAVAPIAETRSPGRTPNTRRPCETSQSTFLGFERIATISLSMPFATRIPVSATMPRTRASCTRCGNPETASIKQQKIDNQRRGRNGATYRPSTNTRAYAQHAITGATHRYLNLPTQTPHLLFSKPRNSSTNRPVAYSAWDTKSW